MCLEHMVKPTLGMGDPGHLKELEKNGSRLDDSQGLISLILFLEYYF